MQRLKTFESMYGEEVVMTVEQLNDDEKKILLRMAREAMEHGVRGEKAAPLDKTSLSPRLLEQGASFVTLTVRGQKPATARFSSGGR